jgi:hypothetical protein
VANALRELKLASREGGADIVFVSSRGHVRSHSNIVFYGWHPAQIAAGVVTPDGAAKYPGLHALRHFYASWCINRREDGGLGLTPKLPHRLLSPYFDRQAALGAWNFFNQTFYDLGVVLVNNPYHRVQDGL